MSGVIFNALCPNCLSERMYVGTSKDNAPYYWCGASSCGFYFDAHRKKLTYEQTQHIETFNRPFAALATHLTQQEGKE